MTINSAAILRLPEIEGTEFSLMLFSGLPCKKIGIEELHMLAAAGHVCARWRGKRIRSVQLIVPADVAFRALGETTRLIRDLLHSDANTTTQRASDSVAQHVKRHHAGHCSRWAGLTPGSARKAVRYDARGVSRREFAGYVDAGAV